MPRRPKIIKFCRKGKQGGNLKMFVGVHYMMVWDFGGAGNPTEE